MCFPANSAVRLSLPEKQPRWKAEPDYNAILSLSEFSSCHIAKSGLSVLIPTISSSTQSFKCWCFQGQKNILSQASKSKFTPVQSPYNDLSTVFERYVMIMMPEDSVRNSGYMSYFAMQQLSNAKIKKSSKQMCKTCSTNGSNGCYCSISPHPLSFSSVGFVGLSWAGICYFPQV